MNEKIREFAIQSGLPTALDYHQKRYEKFAKLIIQDCIDVAYSQGDKVDYLKKHYGIES